MPLNISDAENGMLEAQAKVKEWGAEFLDNWFAPLRETMISIMWQSLTPEQHAVLQAKVPEAYQQLKETMERKEGNNAY